jgi:hypothetical protein
MKEIMIDSFTPLNVIEVSARPTFSGQMIRLGTHDGVILIHLVWDVVWARRLYPM